MSENIEKNLLKVREMTIEDAEEIAQIEAENFSIYRFLHQNNCKICFVKIKKPFGTRAFFNICILYGKTNTIIDIWDTFIIP